MTDTYRVRDLEWEDDQPYSVCRAKCGRVSTDEYSIINDVDELTSRDDWIVIFRGPQGHNQTLGYAFPTLSAAKEAANEHNRQRIAERYLEVVR